MFSCDACERTSTLAFLVPRDSPCDPTGTEFGQRSTTLAHTRQENAQLRSSSQDPRSDVGGRVWLLHRPSGLDLSYVAVRLYLLPGEAPMSSSRILQTRPAVAMTATTTIIRPDVSPAKVSRPVSIALRGPSTTANAHAATKYDIQEHSRPPLPQPFDNIPKLLAHLVTWLCWLCYFQYRFVDTASSNQHHGVKDWFNWMLFVSELVLLLPDLHTAIELTMSLLPGSGRPSRPLLRLVGDAAPMVHVLIT